MPISTAVKDQIDSLLRSYISNKPKDDKDKDWKGKEINEILDKLSRDKDSDPKLLELIAEIGEKADKAQLNGWLGLPNNTSNYTETLYLTIHLIRHSLQKENLDDAIKKEKEELEKLKRKYINAIKQVQKNSVINDFHEQIKKQIRKLAYLGELFPLLTLDLVDSDELYPGRESSLVRSTLVGKGGFAHAEKNVKGMASILTYLPLVLQPEFPGYYASKNGIDFKSETKLPLNSSLLQDEKTFPSMSPLHLSSPSISPASASRTESKREEVLPQELIDTGKRDLTRYCVYKALTKDYSEKTTQINELSKKISNHLKEKAPIETWLKLIIEIGKMADANQQKTIACSTFTEVLYYVLHQLREYIQKHFSYRIQEYIDREKANLGNLEVELYKAKLNNAQEKTIADKEAQIKETRCNLAYLGDIDELLLVFHKLQNPEYYKGTTSTAWGGTVTKWLTGTTIRGFEHTDSQNAYGSKTLIPGLPLVLQDFVEIYKQKYAENLKASINAKIAEETARSELEALKKLIDQLEITPEFNLCEKFQDKNFSELLEQKFTPDVVEAKLSDSYKEIDAKISLVKDLISHTDTSAKNTLGEALKDQTNRVASFASALEKITKTIEQHKLEAARKKAEAERSAYKTISTQIAQLNLDLGKPGISPDKLSAEAKEISPLIEQAPADKQESLKLSLKRITDEIQRLQSLKENEKAEEKARNEEFSKLEHEIAKFNPDYESKENLHQVYEEAAAQFEKIKLELESFYNKCTSDEFPNKEQFLRDIESALAAPLKKHDDKLTQIKLTVGREKLELAESRDSLLRALQKHRLEIAPLYNAQKEKFNADQLSEAKITAMTQHLREKITELKKALEAHLNLVASKNLQETDATIQGASKELQDDLNVIKWVKTKEAKNSEQKASTSTALGMMQAANAASAAVSVPSLNEILSAAAAPTRSPSPQSAPAAAARRSPSPVALDTPKASPQSSPQFAPAFTPRAADAKANELVDLDRLLTSLAELRNITDRPNFFKKTREKLDLKKVTILALQQEEATLRAARSKPV